MTVEDTMAEGASVMTVVGKADAYVLFKPN